MSRRNFDWVAIPCFPYLLYSAEKSPAQPSAFRGELSPLNYEEAKYSVNRGCSAEDLELWAPRSLPWGTVSVESAKAVCLSNTRLPCQTCTMACTMTPTPNVQCVSKAHPPSCTSVTSVSVVVVCDQPHRPPNNLPSKNQDAPPPHPDLSLDGSPPPPPPRGPPRISHHKPICIVFP